MMRLAATNAAPPHLACPLGDGLVSQPQALTDLWRWRGTLKMGKAQQRHSRMADDQGQHDPAKATGADGRLRLEASGSHRAC